MRNIKDILNERLKVTYNEESPIINNFYELELDKDDKDFINIWKPQSFVKLFEWYELKDYLEKNYPELIQEYIPIPDYVKNDKYLKDNLELMTSKNLFLAFILSLNIEDIPDYNIYKSNYIVCNKFNKILNEFCSVRGYSRDIINGIEERYGKICISLWDYEGSVGTITLVKK